MNREEFNQNFILLNAGYAYHNADWNWKNIKSPFARIHFVINGNAKIIREDGTYNLKINHMYLTQSYKKHSYICDDKFELFYIHIYEKINNNLSFFEMIDFPVEIKAEAIDIELIKRLININPDKKLIFFDPKKYDNLSTLAKNMVNKNSSLAIILETEAILKILISRFIANAGCKTKNIDMRILNVIKYIQQNLEPSIIIEELRKIDFFSDRLFSRLFKKD